MKKLFFILVIAIGLSSPVFCASEKEVFKNGLDLLKQDRYHEAVDVFTELIKMAPKNPHAYRNRGVAHMKLNQYDQAIADFERTKKILPDLKGLHSNIGVAWYYKADYSKAIENYDREISLSPDNYFAYFNRAICRAVLEDYDNSLTDVVKAIALLPDFYLAYCLKGDLLVRMNQPQKARVAYGKAISIDPDQTYAKEQLAGLVPDSAPVATNLNGAAPLPVADIQKPAPLKKASPQKKKSKPVTPEKTAPPVLAKADGSFGLQVGAYQVRENAVEMQNKLENKGYKPDILELTRPNNITWFLVRLGSYSRPEDAQKDKDRLKNNLGIDAIVRPSGRF